MEIVRSYGSQDFPVVGRICDRCGLRVSAREDFWEFQEFVQISIDVGYATKVFRDGDLMKCDLCQRCTHSILGQYLRTIATFAERNQNLEKAIANQDRRSGRVVWSILGDS